MRLLLQALIIIISVFQCSAFANALPKVIKQVKPSVVGIGIHTPLSRPQNILRGTGFVIGDGSYVITNDHVLPLLLDEALNQKMAVFVGSGNNAQVRDAEIIDRSKTYDLAILKLSGKSYRR